MNNHSSDPFPKRPRLIFMGTPEFAVPTLEALIREGYDIPTVVSQPDRPKGRGKKLTAPPVKQLALDYGIEVLQPEKVSDPAFCDLIRAREPDLILVVAFGQLLRKNLLDIPGWGVINIHGSLLPRYRGAAPIQRAVLENESRTGLTIMLMDEGMDTGPILFQEEVPIEPEETAGHLHDRLALLAGDLMVRSLRRMAGVPLRPLPQDDALASYAPKIDREMARIDWNREAPRVSSLIRALDPRPGAVTLLDGKEIKVFSSRVARESRPDTVPGRIAHSEEGLVVEAGEGAVEIREIQYPGKKRMPVPDFLRGFPLPGGVVLGR
ncbi:MAG: methionyl-tRNA formyltransferase [Deltaproteobacteria bacterium]|nr:methionyl-tRNA formyltransferase [Deltaproteobacteria bacterium]